VSAGENASTSQITVVADSSRSFPSCFRRIIHVLRRTTSGIGADQTRGRAVLAWISKQELIKLPITRVEYNQPEVQLLSAA
jgi:hypothetical protein